MSAVVLHTSNPTAVSGVSMYSSDVWGLYRVSINNEPLTTLDVQAQSSEHYDLLRKMFVNRGRTLKCAEEVVQSIEGRRTGDDRRLNGQSSIIGFPVPLQPSPQQLTLDVTMSTGFFSGPIKIFWEVVKSI
tara:strand:+ start:47 stop:439 length:393 start_codon:yes stop_codon:yes gene_type:complete